MRSSSSSSARNRGHRGVTRAGGRSDPARGEVDHALVAEVGLNERGHRRLGEELLQHARRISAWAASAHSLLRVEPVTNREIPAALQTDGQLPPRVGRVDVDAPRAANLAALHSLGVGPPDASLFRALRGHEASCLPGISYRAAAEAMQQPVALRLLEVLELSCPGRYCIA